MKTKILDFLNIQKGRIHRVEYFVIGSILKCLDDLQNFLFPDPSTITLLLLAPIGLLQIYVFCLITARRLRDINISGWFSLAVLLLYLIFITIVSIHGINKERHLFDPILIRDMTILFASPLIVIGLCLLFIPPQRKDNKYGPYTTKSFMNLQTPQASSQKPGTVIFRTSLGYYTILLLELTLISLPLILLLNIPEISLDPLAFLKRNFINLSIFVFFAAIFFPVIRHVYPVELTSEGIKSYTNYGIKTECLWEEIASIKVKAPLLISKYIYVQDKDNKSLLVIPYKGLVDFDKFKRTCLEKAPHGNKLSSFLAS